MRRSANALVASEAVLIGKGEPKVGTTSANAARSALAALDEADVAWALLHGRTRLERGVISDIDLVVARPSASAAASFVDALEARRLRPLIVWPYGVAGAGLFLVATDLSQGVQLDLVIDPGGCQPYGVRSDVALADAGTDAGIRTVSRVDSWLYQVSKRSIKGDLSRLQSLLAVRPSDDQTLARRSRELLSPAYADHVVDLIDGRTSPAPARPLGPELSRRARRLLYPAGLWVHVGGPGAPSLAGAIGDRVRPLLRSVAVVRTRALLFSTRVSLPGPRPAVRWRAGMIISHGAAPFGGAIRIDSSLGLSAAIENLTMHAADRAVRHFRRWLASTSH